jgi:hypothetical protein
MPRSLSLTSAQINALTTGDNTILFNAQSRDILLYGGANLEGKIGALEIDNIVGDCLILKYNASSTNYVNFALSNAGTFNVNVNGGNKKFNIVNHDGSTNGLSLGGTLVTSSADQLNAVNTTPGTAEANKALVVDGNLDIIGIHNLETDNLTVNGTLVTASATELNYTDIASAGTAQASKALVVDNNLDIGGLRNLTATGIIDASSHNGDTKGLKLGGVMVTAFASDINKLSSVMEGTVTASKVLIVDSNKDLASIRNLTSSGDLNLSNHDGSTTGLKLAGTLVTSSASQLNTVNVTPGTATASKALVLDSNKDITGIHNLETDNLTVNGTLVTASATELNYTDISTAGAVQASKAVIVDVDKDISGFRNLTTEGNINIYNYNGTTVGLKLAGNLVTSSAAEINTLDGVTPGTVSAGKALVVDSNKDLSSVRNLDVDGGLNIISHDGSTVGLELAGTLVTASASEINKLTGVTPGTVTAGKALIVDSSRDLASIRNLTSSGSIDISNYNGTTTGLKLEGTLITSSAAEINTLNGVSAGTVTASKALVVDSNKDLSSLRNLTLTGTLSGVTTLTATTVAGTLSTAAQPNVTSVGSLTGLTTAGLTLGSTAITATGSEINTLTGVSAGTVTASKALVVDSNKDLSLLRNLTLTGTLSGVTTLTATTVAGTLSTAAQPNVTSVGSLTGLTTAGLTLGSTAITATGSEINTLTGVSAGTVTASKVLVVDSNKDLSSLRNLTLTGTLTANTLSGTLSTASQANITSTGNLTLPGSLTITNGTTLLNFSNTSSSSNFRLSIDSVSGNIDISNNNSSNSTLLSLYANGKRQLTCINNNDYVNLPNHNGSSAGLQLAGTLVTSTAAELNYLSGVTAGIAAASKALVLNGSSNITTGINSLSATTLSATTLTGTLSTAAQTSITSVGTLTGLTVSSSGSTSLRIIDTGTTSVVNSLNVSHYLSSGTAGIGIGSAMLFNAPNAGGSIITYGKISAISSNVTAGSHAGGLFFSSVFNGVFVDSLNLVSSSATNSTLTLAGSSSTIVAANMTCSGTLTLGGTAFSAAVLDSVSGVTPGTASASKALIVDSNIDINSIRNLSMTGTLTVGTVGSSDNRINFKGLTGDSPEDYTVLAERLYGASEMSELLLFKSNDGPGLYGPDRIRLRAPEIRFQVHVNELYSSLGDNNDVMVVQNDTSVAINTLLSIGTSRSYGSSSFGANINVNDCTLSNSYTAASNTDPGHYKKVSIGVSTLTTTLGSGSVTTTNASSLFIQSAPVPGTRMSISNAYALYVNSGNSYFGGDVTTATRLKTTASGFGWQHQAAGCAELVSWVNASSGQIGTFNNNEFAFLQNNTVRMCIDTDGDVGINTRSPIYKLDVAGTIRARTSLLVGDSTDSGRLISALDSTMGNGSVRYFCLGKAASSNNQFEMNYYHVSDGNAENSIGLGFYGSGQKLTIRSNGTIGINNTSPSYPLEVSYSYGYTTPASTFRYRDNSGANGIYVGNSVQICAKFNSPIAVATEMYVTSDERIKTNITEITNKLAKDFILKTKPVSFNYIKSRGGSFHYGYIAQDLARNGFEEIINPVKDDELEEVIHQDGGVSPKGICLHVAYQNIIPILGQNIKNIYEDNEKLENKIKILEEKNNDLESRLKKLENMILNI